MGSLLAAGLSTLAGGARIEISLPGIKNMWGGPSHLGLRSGARLWRLVLLAVLRRLVLLPILRRLLVGAVFHPLTWSRHGLLLRGRRTVITSAIVAAAVLIDLRIIAVDVAIDNLVAHAGAIVPAGRRVGTAVEPIIASAVSGAPVAGVVDAVRAVVVRLNVVVIRVSVDRVVAIDVVDVYRAVDDVPVHGDVVVAVVDVTVV